LSIFYIKLLPGCNFLKKMTWLCYKKGVLANVEAPSPFFIFFADQQVALLKWTHTAFTSPKIKKFQKNLFN